MPSLSSIKRDRVIRGSFAENEKAENRADFPVYTSCRLFNARSDRAASIFFGPLHQNHNNNNDDCSHHHLYQALSLLFWLIEKIKSRLDQGHLLSSCAVPFKSLKLEAIFPCSSSNEQMLNVSGKTFFWGMFYPSAQ